MSLTLASYVLLFFTASILGWIMEVVCKLIQFHRFINRGFLIGPYCPIYGFGAVLVTTLLSPFSAYPVAVFLLAMIVCGTLEYLTGYFMEKLFHARWWDYSHKRFNLNGRVCADTLIPFGLLGLGMIYGVKPLLFGAVAGWSRTLVNGLCIGLTALLVTDTVVSTCVLSRIRRTVANTQGDSTEEITRSVREALAKQSALVRRTLRAFPFAKLYNTDLLSKLKADKQRLRQDVKAAQQKLHGDILAREDALKQDLHVLRHGGK